MTEYVQVWDNAHYTWLSPFRFNLYDLLQMPRPQNGEKRND